MGQFQKNQRVFAAALRYGEPVISEVEIESCGPEQAILTVGEIATDYVRRIYVEKLHATKSDALAWLARRAKAEVDELERKLAAARHVVAAVERGDVRMTAAPKKEAP